MIALTENSVNRLVIEQDQSAGSVLEDEESVLMVLLIALALFWGHQFRGQPHSHTPLPFLSLIALFFMGRWSACSKCVFDREQDTLVKAIAAHVLPTMRPKIYFLTDIIAVELVSRGMFRSSYFIQVKNRWNQRIKLNIIALAKESEAREIAEAVSRFLKFSQYNEISSGKQVTHRIR
jgi:hypothetical protein